MNIKTRIKFNKFKEKSIHTWYFCMKPLVYLFKKIDDYKEYRLEHKKWNEKKIRKELSKQIQKIVLCNHKYKYKSFYVNNTYIYDIRENLSNIYRVLDFFGCDLLYSNNGYLKKYYYSNNYKDSEFIEKWLPVILELCENNGLDVKEINKDHMCSQNKYWKYDTLYKELDRVWEVKFDVVI